MTWSLSWLVSIHATLAGGDWLARLLPTSALRFYPRHPRGWRRIKFRLLAVSRHISIHATLAGGDTSRRSKEHPKQYFYPRHPRGWRHTESDPPKITEDISIHATLAGGDPSVSVIFTWFPVFLSTPPSRVATPALARSVAFDTFLSTPPSRVATSLPGRGLAAVAVSIHATLAGGDSCRPSAGTR